MSSSNSKPLKSALKKDDKTKIQTEKNDPKLKSDCRHDSSSKTAESGDDELLDEHYYEDEKVFRSIIFFSH